MSCALTSLVQPPSHPLPPPTPPHPLFALQLTPQDADGFPVGKGVLIHGDVGSAALATTGGDKEHGKEGEGFPVAAAVEAGGERGAGRAVEEDEEEEEKQSQESRYQVRDR